MITLLTLSLLINGLFAYLLIRLYNARHNMEQISIIPDKDSKSFTVECNYKTYQSVLNDMKKLFIEQTNYVIPYYGKTVTHGKTDDHTIGWLTSYSCTQFTRIGHNVVKVSKRFEFGCWAKELYPTLQLMKSGKGDKQSV